MHGLSLAAASRGYSLLWCAGFSLRWLLLLQSAGSVVVAHGLSCSAACGIFPDQGMNPCPPHWQADSQPLRHQGNPIWLIVGTSWDFCYFGQEDTNGYMPADSGMSKSASAASHPHATFSDVILVAWNWPCEACLYHRNHTLVNYTSKLFVSSETTSC